MENRTPTTPKGSQAKQRKRPHPEMVPSVDEKSSATKMQRTREETETSVEIREVVTTYSNAALQDGNKLSRFGKTINIPRVSPNDFNRGREDMDISKPDFDYDDLCCRLLSLEPFQNIESDLIYEQYDLKSANTSYTNSTSACQPQENIRSLSSHPSISDLYRPLCGLSCTSIKDSISESRLSPVIKPHHYRSQCEIGYPCRSSVSEHVDCGIPPSLQIESVEPPYIQSDYLQWCITEENQEISEMIETNPHIYIDVQTNSPNSQEPFAFKDANDVSPQVQQEIPEKSNVSSSVQNDYTLDLNTPSTSRQHRRYVIVMWIDKTERTIEKGGGTTARPYVTKVTVNNNSPCDIFNPNPKVLIGAKYVGISNDEVLKRIDYFNTAFGVCNVMNPELGRTQVLVMGINPNGENLVIGSSPHSCKLVVAKDVRGIRRVILQTTQDFLVQIQCINAEEELSKKTSPYPFQIKIRRQHCC